MPKDPELARRIRERPFFHTIDLGDGLVTSGHAVDFGVFDAEGALPDMRGKSVLDIGAWDGKHSFAAEKAGAARVVALDHYVWRLDWSARQAYYERCAAQGVLPDGDLVDSGFLVDGTPGKEGFDLIHDYLDSDVESVADDFTTMDLDGFGPFDVVLYCGVLYHMVDPFHALKRVRRVTGEVAVIETAGVYVPGYSTQPLLRFFAADDLNGDYGNWFAPNELALIAMCRAAGFSDVRIVARSELNQSPSIRARLTHKKTPINCRLVVHARP